MLQKQLTYLVDYDDMSSLATDKQKIDWLYNRVNKFLIKPVGKLIKNQDTELGLELVTVICCGIEAISHFLEGRVPKAPEIHEGSRDDFRLFIEKYMPEYNLIKNDLYSYFRCGLAHAFAVERGSFEYGVGKPSVQIMRQQSFYKIDLEIFFDRFEKGIKDYFSDLSSDRAKIDNFVKRFNYSFKFWINNPPSSKNKSRGND